VSPGNAERRPRARSGVYGGSEADSNTNEATIAEDSGLFAVSRGEHAISFTETAGSVESLRDRGFRLVGQGADGDANNTWRHDTERIVRQLIAAGNAITADVARDHGAHEPPSPNAWGALFNALAREGLIARAGNTISRRPSAHGREVKVWEPVR
jgi:hypothetical protein